ncbi:hypothetical protein L5515_015419 [Caenorhabditis briggsae]|uniref:Uncharacterized protein n=1 Tax=Caenorhabditis briggsae TaxID=6238 RepID=A0AAE9J849_CAEBR|nr:hypothetical protein L5515_015419 [Caenorhabditis briggsae]
MPDLRTTAQRLEDVTAQASYWKGKLRIIEKQMSKLEKETKVGNERLTIERDRLELGQIQLQATVVELMAANARLFFQCKNVVLRIKDYLNSKHYQDREQQGNVPGEQNPGNRN